MEVLEIIILVALATLLLLVVKLLQKTWKGGNSGEQSEQYHRLQTDLQLAQANVEHFRNQHQEAKNEIAQLRQIEQEVVQLRERNQQMQQVQQKMEELQMNHENVQQQFAQTEANLYNTQQNFAEHRAQHNQLQEEKRALQENFDTQHTDLLHTQAQFKALQEKLAQQQQDMDKLQKKFQMEFENVANKILEVNSEKFTEKNQKNIHEILNPLHEKLKSFEKKVEDTYEKGLKDQTDMKAELKKLQDLNHRISQEAHSLTKALQSDNKKQGNWGEMILDKVLERSGLREGAEYSKQYSAENDEGKRLQPDVVINLPDDKHIIVDSKVSLVAYTNWVNAEDEAEKAACKKAHIASLQAHVKGLSEKHYNNLKGINSPDFVLLFLPIESSFSMAIEGDNDLYGYAWDRKVVIVSPSTLLATLRTVASIWKQENQTRNILEIADAGAKLYDKFVGFVEDMEKIGKGIESTRISYDNAMKKLSEGRGNLVNSTQKLRKLGVKSKKDLPEHMLE
ncbi:MAG: DNA recombination protein RmuC [Mangrovibacterium sp.]